MGSSHHDRALTLTNGYQERSKNVAIMASCFGVVFMKKLELYLFRGALVTILAAVAASPFVAAGHLFYGFVSRTMQTTHLLALAYLMLIALALFLISPAFGDNKR